MDRTEKADSLSQEKVDRLTGKALRLADELGKHDEIQRLIYRPVNFNNISNLLQIVVDLEEELESETNQ